MKVARTLRTGAPDEQAWRALQGGAWAGPVRVAADGATYAGALQLVDEDEDRRRVGVRAQARRATGWGGITLAATAMLGGGRRGRTIAVLGEATLSGEASRAAADALAAEIERRLERAVRDLDASRADDPAWRRQLALRAAAAVGLGVAAGIAGAAWGRRRRA
jgi:carbon monoxide dehydrogenase subunit G